MSDLLAIHAALDVWSLRTFQKAWLKSCQSRQSMVHVQIEVLAGLESAYVRMYIKDLLDDSISPVPLGVPNINLQVHAAGDCIEDVGLLPPDASGHDCVEGFGGER